MDFIKSFGVSPWKGIFNDNYTAGSLSIFTGDFILSFDKIADSVTFMLQIPNMGFGEYTVGTKMGPIRWSCHDLFVVLRGKVFLEVEKHPFHLTSGDAVMIPPNSLFQGQVSGKKATIWVLHFFGYTPIHPSSRFMQRRTAFSIRKAVSDLFYRQCIDKMEEIYKTKNSSYRQTTLHNLTTLLLGHVEALSFQYRTPSTAPKPFDEILAWARKNLSSVQTRTLARKALLSESHFRAKFRKFYGVSPSKILKDYRLQEAKRLLQHSQRPIKEISHLTGYSDIASFHRAFKSAGITPAKYRISRKNVI